MATNRVLLTGTLPEPFPSLEEVEKACSLLLEQIQQLDGVLDGPHELSLTLTDDATIQAINRKYRNKDTPTDVLSFPLLDFSDNEEEEFPFPVTEVEALGDVVISLDRCRAQAQEVGHGVADEFYRLLVHGILHLYGYDHEISSKEEARMKSQEDELLAYLARQGH